MYWQSHLSLQHFNTFHIDVTANSLVSCSNIDELTSILQHEKVKAAGFLVLGGGSNILFTKAVQQVVLLNNIKGITIVLENDDFVQVKFGAGEIWHNCVLWAVNHHFGGIENLSLIPGTIGAAPIQNIGAYGVELKDVLLSCEVLEVDTLKLKTITNSECEFGYRTSIFKTTQKGKYIITAVTLQLQKVKEDYIFNTSYGNIQDELQRMNIKALNIKDVSDAVVNIRSSKLPNPDEIGNAGSFFKNPVIDKKQFEVLKNKFENIPYYLVNEHEVKVPAGWLIEQCGWKGYRENDIGVHKNQALVLVNYGNAKGIDIYQLSEKIINSVEEKYGITLEREVNIM